MKCAARRLGEEVSDLDDVRDLLRRHEVSSVQQALAISTRYSEEDRLPAKTQLALAELLGR